MQASRRRVLAMRCLIACCVLMSLAPEALAQDDAVYINAGVSFPHQAEPDPGLTRPPFSAPGGSSVGWLVGAGVFVSPRLSIEGELSRTGAMTSEQEGRGFVEKGERRDWFVSVGLKGHVPLGSALTVEPVGGIVFVRGDVTFEGFRFQTRFSGGQAVTEVVPTGNGYVELDWNPGLMFGVDVRIGGQRLAFVPGVRFAFTGVPDGSTCVIGFAGDPICSESGEPYLPGFYPRWTQRPSVALAVNF
jgi:hypothetical protein